MDHLGNRLRRAFDLQPLTPRSRQAEAKRVKREAMARRAASLDALGDWKRLEEVHPDAMFGRLIGDAVDEETGVNKFVKWCIEAIETTGQGLKTDGIYRVTVGQGGANRISWQPERSMQRLLEREKHVHVLTAALKMFFKNLKRPLMRMDDFQPALQSHLSDVESTENLQEIISSLPAVERNTIACLFQHLRRVVDTQENNMTLAPLSANFGQTLLRLRAGSIPQATMAREMKTQNHLVWLLLLHADTLFGPTGAAAQVTDYAGDDEMDTSSKSSDDEKGSSSPTSKRVVDANVKNYKRNSSLLSNNDKLFREKIDSTSSNGAQNSSNAKMQLLFASSEKRKSYPSAKKDNEMEKKNESSPPVKSNSLMKKLVVEMSSMRKKKKEKVTTDKTKQTSSSDDESETSKGKRVLETKTQNQKSVKSTKKGKPVQEEENSSSSDEDHNLSKNKPVLDINTDEKIQNSGKTETKMPVVMPKWSSSSSDDLKGSKSKHVVEASQLTYETNPTLPMTKKQKHSSSSSDKELLHSPKQRPMSEASASFYKKFTLPPVEIDDVFHDEIQTPSPMKPGSPVKEPIFNASPEIYFNNPHMPDDEEDVNEIKSFGKKEGNTTQKSKKASVKSFMKKMQNKIIPFQVGKKKRKSSASDDEKDNENKSDLNLNELDVMHRPKDDIVIPPQTMITFNSSIQASQQQTTTEEAENKIVKSPLIVNSRHELQDSSSNDDTDDQSKAKPKTQQNKDKNSQMKKSEKGKKKIFPFRIGKKKRKSASDDEKDNEKKSDLNLNELDVMHRPTDDIVIPPQTMITFNSSIQASQQQTTTEEAGDKILKSSLNVNSRHESQDSCSSDDTDDQSKAKPKTQQNKDKNSQMKKSEKGKKKIFSFRIGKKKRKSASDDEKDNEKKSYLNLNELDVMHRPTDDIVIPPQTMITFNSSIQASQQQTTTEEAEEKIIVKSLLNVNSRHESQDSSSSDDTDDSSKAKPKIQQNNDKNSQIKKSEKVKLNDLTEKQKGDGIKMIDTGDKLELHEVSSMKEISSDIIKSTISHVKTSDKALKTKEESLMKDTNTELQKSEIGVFAAAGTKTKHEESAIEHTRKELETHEVNRIEIDKVLKQDISSTETENENSPKTKVVTITTSFGDEQKVPAISAHFKPNEAKTYPSPMTKTATTKISPPNIEQDMPKGDKRKAALPPLPPALPKVGPPVTRAAINKPNTEKSQRIIENDSKVELSKSTNVRSFETSLESLPGKQTRNSKGMFMQSLLSAPISTSATDNNFTANKLDAKVPYKNVTFDKKVGSDYTIRPKEDSSAENSLSDKFKPVPSLTEVFNSNSIADIDYAPPLVSDREESSNSLPKTLDIKSRRVSTSSSNSSESFTDSSGDLVPIPAASSGDHQQKSVVGVKTSANVPTAL